MTDITRTQYKNLIAGLRAYPAGRTPVVNANDILRAAGIGDGNAANAMVVESPASMVNVTEAEIPVDGTAPGDVSGSDVRDLVQSKATTWSNVRRIRYEVEGDTPGTGVYIRYGHITTAQPGTPVTSSVPATTDSIFDPLDAGNEISLSQFNNILTALGTLVNTDSDEDYPFTVFYCHSQCHSDCHASRGRR